MRIISKFRDYYDSVMNTGMDRDVVYVRETLETKVDTPAGMDFSTYSVSSSYTVNMVLLGYCGTFFKIYVVEITADQGGHKTRSVFHDYLSFQEFMLGTGLGSKYEFGEARWWPSAYQKFRDFNPAPFEKLFHEQQTPLFTIKYVREYRKPSKHVAILGPCLKDLEFYKVKDSYTAYQDIFQYVSGVLNRSENKMVKISDTDKVAKHGFDKWSFRQKGPKK